MPKYAELIYNGFWWSPEREMLQVAIDHSQEFVSGVVRLKLFKGNVDVVGRKSPHSLFDEKIATFEDDGGTYDQADAEGFIKLNALRLRNLARNGVSRELDAVARSVRWRPVGGAAGAERQPAVRPAHVP